MQELKEGYLFDDFPSDRFYIIRWLKDGGWHLYPNKNGEKPEGFASRKAAEDWAFGTADNQLPVKWFAPDEVIIVSAKDASKYQIPKRW